MRVAVVIPAFQAATTIRDVIVRIKRTLPAAHIIVVDDGSTDGTVSAAAAYTLGHAENLGKGAALRDGIQEAITHGASVVVTIDADGQHPPEAIPSLLEPVRAGRADLVLGARKRGSGMPLGRRFTNWLSATVASRIGGQPIPDAQTGFRAFTRQLAEQVRPDGDRYEFEANFLLRALRAGYRVASVEVPTIYGPSSHFRIWRDTWLMARTFARHAIGTS